jgi:hypothetical protein
MFLARDDVLCSSTICDPVLSLCTYDCPPVSGGDKVICRTATCRSPRGSRWGCATSGRHAYGRRRGGACEAALGNGQAPPRYLNTRTGAQLTTLSLQGLHGHLHMAGWAQSDIGFKTRCEMSFVGESNGLWPSDTSLGPQCTGKQQCRTWLCSS